ncbi:sporulation integral membrane protein YtvI [Paenibacillus sp. CAA11]|uniref:sporulation integral membrane protein YtvI n=1 Tax=Paenibacillus sp. CAA11 TaxID=1532905 RepID=UPI000D37D611|nr:sporulation integral membrane protein YtvI [Paenibacillus sp. CAA11]AWB44066.1 sporulation integral membrane protein YtvI [Paenibacillus sp. CAA11]
MDNILVKRILRGVWVLTVLGLLILAVYWLVPLLYPFLIAWLIAYAMKPFVRFLQDRVKLPRWLAVTLGLLVYFGGAALVLSAAVTRMVKEVIHLTQSFDIHVDQVRDFFVKWTESDSIQNIIMEINKFIADNPNYEDTINNNINKTTETISSAVSRFVSDLLGGIVNILTSLPNVLLILIVVILATFFIGKNWEKHTRTLAAWFPSPLRKTAKDVWASLQKALFGYLRSLFIMVSITAVIVLIGLLILRVDSAFTLAIVIGLVDLLPYLGVGTVMVPWILYTFMIGNLPLGIGLLVLYGVITVARHLIEPKVLATSVGLDPLPTLVGMFVGLKLFGVLGLIIGPVSFVVIAAVYRTGVFRDLRNYIVHGRLH